MATATQLLNPTVRLELTLDEAVVLRDILMKVGGMPDSRRATSDSVLHALHKVDALKAVPFVHDFEGSESNGLRFLPR